MRASVVGLLLFACLAIAVHGQMLIEDDSEEGFLDRTTWCSLVASGPPPEVIDVGGGHGNVLHIGSTYLEYVGALCEVPTLEVGDSLTLEADVFLVQAASRFDLQLINHDPQGCVTVNRSTEFIGLPTIRNWGDRTEVLVYYSAEQGAYDAYVVPGGQLSSGIWHSFRLVITADDVACYLDGELKLQENDLHGALDEDHDWVLRIGDDDSFGNQCNAYFDNVKLYLGPYEATPEEFYDDFAYLDVDDAAAFGWNAVDDNSAPPEDTSVYDAANVNFQSNPEGPSGDCVMTLWSIVDGAEVPVNSRIETIEKKFLYGTYCARVRFEYTPSEIYPANEDVQTFYVINWLPGQDDYSECDFEYLPWNFWGESCGDGIPTLWVNTWETTDNEDPVTDDERKADSYCRSDEQELEGWYYLLLHVRSGSVTYSIAPDSSGVPATTDWTKQHYEPYVPETQMQIAFANWTNEPTDGHTDLVVQEMTVDWVYHVRNSYLSAQQVCLRVDALRSLYPSALRYDSMSTDSATVAFAVDAGGDLHSSSTLYAQSFESGAADVAEWVLVTESVDPGDVLEMDPSLPGTYRRSQILCSPLIAGVVSTKPGVTLGAHDDISNQALLALSGIVPANVTNEGGPIQPGDLLVTSSTPGHAMRWAQLEPCLCSLVGKALEPMTEERGVILVLLTAH